MKSSFITIFIIGLLCNALFAQTYTWSELKNLEANSPRRIIPFERSGASNFNIQITDVALNVKDPKIRVETNSLDKPLIAGLETTSGSRVFNFAIEKSTLKDGENTDLTFIYIDTDDNATKDQGALTASEKKAGDDPVVDDDSDDNDPEALLGYALGYNFLGDAKLNNVTPEIFLGWTENFKLGQGKNQGSVDVGPVIFPNQGIVDSSSVIPALLLPGNINLVGGITNEFLLSPNKELETGSTVFFSAGVGFKLISSFAYSDTIGSLAQHYGRVSAGFKYATLFTFNGSFVFGGHNLTNNSENNYKKIFNSNKTGIQYLLINVQTQITGKSANTNKLFLFASWRYLLNRRQYEGFTPDRIISIGITQTFDFKKGVRAVSAQSNR